MAEGGPKIESRVPGSDSSALATETHNILQAVGLRPLLLGTSLFFVVLLVVGLLHAPARVAVPVALYGLLSSGFCLGLWLALGRQLIPQRWGHPVVAAICWLVASNSLLTAWLVDDVLFTATLPVVLVAAGSFMLSYGWLAVTCSVVLLAGGAIAYLTGGPDALGHILPAMAVAAAVAVAFVADRLANLRRLHATLQMNERLTLRSEAVADRVDLEPVERLVARAERDKVEGACRRHPQETDSLGALARGVAHDTNNVLTVITTLSSALKDDPSLDSIAREDAAEILEAAERGAALIRMLLGRVGREHGRHALAVARDADPRASTLRPQPVEQKATVLIADDERSVRWVTERVLAECGYRVIAVEDGQRAIDEYRIHQQAIALVILDVEMPGMSGAECLATLRQLNPKARVLFVSGYTSSDEIERLLEAGASGFIQKPFDAAGMAEAVRAALRAPQ